MKKIIALIIVACIVIFGIIIPLNNTTGISKMQVKDEMNGFGTKKIGEYGIAYYTGNISDTDIIKFYDKNVKDSKLNYISLIDKKDPSKGYFFNGSSDIFSYGKIGKDGTLGSTDKLGVIENDKIVYK